MKFATSIASRTILLLGALGIVGAVCNVLVWAQTEPGHLSYIAPGTALGLIARQLGNASFSHFNIPLFSIAYFLIWAFGVWGVGELITEKLLPAAALPEERLLFSFAAGFLAIGIAVLAYGMQTTTAMTWVLTAIATTIALLKRNEFAKLCHDLPPPLRFPLGTHAARNLCSTFALICITASFVYALTPPVQSDAIRYHLGAPQEYLKAGKITYLPHNAFSNFPFLAEMHFMLALGAGAPEGTQIMHWSLYLAIALGVSAFVKRFVEPLFPGRATSKSLPRILCCLLYLTAPASMILSAWPFIDHAVTLYFFCVIYALLLAFEFGGKRMYALVGLMAAGALGTKYTALPFLAIPAVIIAVEWMAFSPPPAARSRRTIRIGVLAVAALVTAALSGEWFLKSFLLTGNPVYPLANSRFHGGDWTTASASLYAEHVASKGVGKGIASLLASPLDSTFVWPAFEHHYLGPALLVVFIGGLIGTVLAIARIGPQSRPVVYAQAAALGYYLLWFFSYQSNRMLLPFLALSLPAFGYLLLECLFWQIWLLRIVAAALTAGMLHSTSWAIQWIYAVPQNPPPLAYLLGNISREDFLTRSLNYYRAFQTLNSKPGSKTLLIGEHRIYYAQFNAVWSDWFDTPAVLALVQDNKVSTAPDLIALLRKQGIGWILYNDAELKPQLEQSFRPRFSNSEWALLTATLNSDEFTKQTIPPGVTLYRLKDK